MAKGAHIQAGKLVKAFKESESGQTMVAVGLAMFRYAFTSGLAAELSRKRAGWAPLSRRYVAWKRRHGYGEGAWEMSGRTLRAITANPPTKVGLTKGAQFGINFFNNFAFVRPARFAKGGSGKWQALSAGAFAVKVLNVLKYGNRRSKVGSWEAKTGKDAGLKVGRTEGVLPPRPLFAWSPSWIAHIERDVDAALAGELTRQGVNTKKK